MREIKFRAWDREYKTMLPDYYSAHTILHLKYQEPDNFQVMQYTGLKDKNDVEIFFGDILVFADKWEWYRGKYAIKMMAADDEKKTLLQKAYDDEPLETRVVKSIEDYDWLLSSDIQTYWEVIGNIHENPELLVDDDENN